MSPALHPVAWSWKLGSLWGGPGGGRATSLPAAECCVPTPASVVTLRSPHQVLDVIAPPYTSDFVQLFLPILENDSIAGTIKAEGEHDPVTEFIGKALTVPLPRWPPCSSPALTQ